MGKAAIKEKPDLVEQALDQMYSEEDSYTVPNAKRILRRHGQIFIHAEPPSGAPVEGSVTKVTCEHKLESAIQESFVNAAGLTTGRQKPYIWFSGHK